MERSHNFLFPFVGSLPRFIISCPSLSFTQSNQLFLLVSERKLRFNKDSSFPLSVSLPPSPISLSFLRRFGPRKLSIEGRERRREKRGGRAFTKLDRKRIYVPLCVCPPSPLATHPSYFLPVHGIFLPPLLVFAESRCDGLRRTTSTTNHSRNKYDSILDCSSPDEMK